MLESAQRHRHAAMAGRGGTGPFVVVVATVLALAASTWTWFVVWPDRHCYSEKLEIFQGSPVSSLQWESPSATASSSSASSSALESLSAEPQEEDSEFEPSPGASLELPQVVFGIAGSASLWPRRQELVRLWWRSGDMMRGHVWLERAVQKQGPGLPPVRVSENVSGFSYTNPAATPDGIRIARIVLETVRLGLPDVRWIVLADDDTVFNVENLVRVLRKYDSSEMYYIGSNSESHSANTFFSHSMAFGGGGIAISYPLAVTLSEMLDECIERYSGSLGSDDRLHACISELGVPLTHEPGFHQWDIRGNAHGLLASHPVTPFVSFHHLEAVSPVFPQHTSLVGLKLLAKAMNTDPSNFLQQSICYDRKRKLSISVSMGYVVQVFPGIILPRELERTELTFTAWNHLKTSFEFDFDTRPPQRSYCKKPLMFFFKEIQKKGNMTVSTYSSEHGRTMWRRNALCFSWGLASYEIQDIQVMSKPLKEHGHLVPRRQCCQVTEEKNKILGLKVGACEDWRIMDSAKS